MKHMKKMICFLLAVILLLGCSVTSLADAEAQHVITITNEKAGHVYQVYQIFKGDLDTTKTILSNIEWGDGVDGASLLAALQEQEVYTDCEDAAEVAEVLKGFSNDSEALDSFAETAELYLTADVAGTSMEETSPYTIPVTGDGYYLIKDSGDIGDGDAYTKFILQVVKNVEVKAKAEAPTLEKQIVEETGLVEANSASVGDTVEYLLTSKVPDMDGYNKYFYIIHDTLDAGLDFHPESVEIKVGDMQIDASAYQIVTEGVEDECTFEIVFKDFIQYKEQLGSVISISYTATVNTDAVIGNLGNANKAHLEYSNNPNVTQIGDSENPDKPAIGDVTGVTPDDVTITYLTGIELIKMDDSENGIRLQGAEFKISGEKLNKVKTVKGVYTEDVNGSYYRLKDGTYTETAPLEETMDRYESTEVMYTLSTETEWVTVTEDVNAQAMVDINGELHFHGLAAGEYVIEEMKAPNGYNILDKPIYVEITFTTPEDIETGLEETEWKYSVSGAMAQTEQIAENGVVQLSVVNKSGAVLPSTGGHGVFLLSLIGIAVASTAVLLKNRKRPMNEA